MGEQDLLRVEDDMLMLKRQVKVRPPTQPHQRMGQSGASLLTSNLSASQLDTGTEQDLSASQSSRLRQGGVHPLLANSTDTYIDRNDISLDRRSEGGLSTDSSDPYS